MRCCERDDIEEAESSTEKLDEIAFAMHQKIYALVVYDAGNVRELGTSESVRVRGLIQRLGDNDDFGICVWNTILA